MQKQLTIGWKVSTLDLAMASLRYRAILPAVALEAYGIRSQIIARASRRSLAGLDALVIVKSFTLEDYWLAEQAVDRKIPVIFDLCDNVFIERYTGKGKLSPADIFLLIAHVASAVVVTTEPLQIAVREHIGSEIPIFVVPDGIEDEGISKSAHRILRQSERREKIYRAVLRSRSIVVKARSIAGRAYKSLKSGNYLNLSSWIKLAYRIYGRVRNNFFSFQTRSETTSKLVPMGPLLQSDFGVLEPPRTTTQRKKILWFGNHGAKHAKFGMLDLLFIQADLEKISREIPIELVVVSNNYEKYRKNIQSFQIPSSYIEWSADSIIEQLHNADVVVIPNSLDPFSICKSANRSVLALSHGVPVVATKTPALEALDSCITLDDFEGGLRRYLTDSVFAKAHVQHAQKLISQLYAPQIIGCEWNMLLKQVLHREIGRKSEPETKLIVAIQLPQDIDLVRPVLKEARQRGIHCVIWTSLEAVKRWPQIGIWLPKTDAVWRIFREDLKDFDANLFPDSAFALLTVTETNLSPHRFAHKLTRSANAAGLYTATMQHGYENVGLTYSDPTHDIKRVEFASKIIYIWGPETTLHHNITSRARKKCLSVGCPKPQTVDQANLSDHILAGHPVIGIFENLHWHRYSDEYRKFFLEGVRRLAETFPDIEFLVKPHNAGMWLTGRYKGNKPEAPNLIIVDPRDRKWESVTAPQLLQNLTAVITSPSTVALDSARMQLPTAVVSGGLELANYLPLYLIDQVEDWENFVNQALDIHARQSLIESSQLFVDRVLVKGDASSRILDDIMSHKKILEVTHAS
jgi:glycosyltransferase involved in cell wall biosynthesis